jgi:hypothetical protein
MVTDSALNEQRLSAVSAYRIYVLKVKVKEKVKFNLEQATKPHKGRRGIALLFL